MDDHTPLVEEFLTASRVLIAIAVRSIDAADPPVTAPQHRLLVLLAARGAQLIGDLATELNVNSSSATRQCDRLERKGLVSRARSTTDGRAVVVSLTPSGRDVLDVVTSVRRAEISAVVERMGPADASQVLAALRTFSAAADEPADAQWLGVPQPSTSVTP